MLAAGECKREAPEALLAYHVDVNAKDGKSTALDHALLMKHDDCVELLTSHGAKRYKDL